MISNRAMTTTEICILYNNPNAIYRADYCDGKICITPMPVRFNTYSSRIFELFDDECGEWKKAYTWMSLHEYSEAEMQEKVLDAAKHDRTRAQILFWKPLEETSPDILTEKFQQYISRPGTENVHSEPAELYGARYKNGEIELFSCPIRFIGEHHTFTQGTDNIRQKISNLAIFRFYSRELMFREVEEHGGNTIYFWYPLPDNMTPEKLSIEFQRHLLEHRLKKAEAQMFEATDRYNKYKAEFEQLLTRTTI